MKILQITRLIHLHSTMFLLHRCHQHLKASIYIDLHSTMFLLHHSRTTVRDFTRRYLHSTMFLLHHYMTRDGFSILANLHSTMFLLHRGIKNAPNRGISSFTFHYVSITSQWAENVIVFPLKFTFHYVSITSALVTHKSHTKRYIYIPLCFYYIW